MSVDYYSCEHCGKSEYEEFVHYCPKCERFICEDCFNQYTETPQYIDNKEDITKEQYKYLCDKYGKDIIDDGVIGEGEINPEYCPFCGGSEVHNDDLLDFALLKLKLTRNQFLEEYLKQNK